MVVGLLYVPMSFSKLAVVVKAICMKFLWNFMPYFDSYCLERVVFTVPVSINKPVLCVFPGCYFALGRCASRLHMQSYLTPAYLLIFRWIGHSLLW